MTPAERRDKIAELKAIREGLIATNRYIASNLEVPTRILAEADELEALAAKSLKEAKRLRDSLEHGKDHMVANHARIKEIRDEVLRLETEEKLARLLELQAELNDILPE